MWTRTQTLTTQNNGSVLTKLRMWSVIVDNNNDVNDINTNRQPLVRWNDKNTVEGHRVGIFA